MNFMQLRAAAAAPAARPAGRGCENPMIYSNHPGPFITFPLEEPCFVYGIQALESGVTAISLQDGVKPCAPWEGQAPHCAAVENVNPTLIARACFAPVGEMDQYRVDSRWPLFSSPLRPWPQVVAS